MGAEGIRGNDTPPSAVHYLQTLLTPSLGARMNVRSMRVEVKTLCEVFDRLARKQPKEAADIVAQRVKAVERACQEEHWQSAQYLELINPEAATLLDRGEQVFLAREFLLDQKVRHYDKGSQRTGKGEQKGQKGKGPKGDRDRGAGGKGKDKADLAGK